MRGKVLSMERHDIVKGFYGKYNEDGRLDRSRHGQLEYRTTMAFIHRFLSPCAKVLEIGAGTGRYSLALAKEGFDVTALELAESNLAILKDNSRSLKNIRAIQGDAVDLSRFDDDSFDITLALGPMYHLYESNEIQKAIDEAIRVTKSGGTLLFAFLSVYAIMYSNYLVDNWTAGQDENFTDEYAVRHFKEQLFTGYDIEEFEALFKSKPVSHITTAGMDGMLEALEPRADFALSDDDFEKFSAWQLALSEKRELLGSNSHLLYICNKK